MLRGFFLDLLNDNLKAELIGIAHRLADCARIVTLRYFRDPDIKADNKDKAGFDPVTIADREAEMAMRAILAERRPADGILGEEFGAVLGTSGLTWVLDPIDGTRGFMSGTPTWGVLIAVNAGEAPLFGVIDQPYVGERFEGGFGISQMTGPQGQRGLSCRATADLSDAVLFSTFPEIGSEAERSAFQSLALKTRLVRYGMDCYAYALLAAGHVDLVVEAGLNSYDIQAPIAVIQAAGGVVTDWQGGPAHDGGQVLAAANKTLHRQACAILNRS